MRLYTEEQVRATWNTAFMEGMSIDSEIYEPVFFEDHLNALTPIEIPSDEEIDRMWPLYYTEFRNGLNEGAKQMRNKIKEIATTFSRFFLSFFNH